MANFKPTQEQNAIVESFRGGDNLCIEALAGSGKTSTLVMLADAIPDEKFVYIAYNRAIAKDAKRDFGRNTTVATAHSFAFRAIGKKYEDRLNSSRITARQMANNLRIYKSFEISPKLWLSESKIAMLAKGTVTNFCYSSDTEIKSNHVPKVIGAEFIDQLRIHVLPFAKKIWEDAQLIDGRFKFEHDYYLKMYALTEPTLPGDVILADEMQDANPCIASIFDAQIDSQRIAVGDKFQQLYAWRGAVDYLSTMKADQRLYLSKSFRFGDAIADEANKWLDRLGSPKPIEGFDKIDSSITILDEPDAILCRTNAQVIVEALCASGITYDVEAKHSINAIGGKQLMSHEEDPIKAFGATKKKFAIVGGTNDIKRFAGAAADLMSGRGCNHPDLMAFQTWQQVKEFVTEEASDMKVLVKLVDDHGVEILTKIADAAVEEKDADVILSTAHKSKGRQWSSVKIANDFVDPTTRADGEEPDPKHIKGELCLGYVAITRAQHKLDVGGLDWINK